MNWYKPEDKAKEQLILISHIAPKAYGEAFKSYAKASGFPKVYCLGHEWFEGGKAPYPVFTVEDEKIVISEN